MIVLILLESYCGDRFEFMSIVIATVWLSGEDWPAWMRFKYRSADVWKHWKYDLMDSLGARLHRWIVWFILNILVIRSTGLSFATIVITYPFISAYGSGLVSAGVFKNISPQRMASLNFVCCQHGMNDGETWLAFLPLPLLKCRLLLRNRSQFSSTPSRPLTTGLGRCLVWVQELWECERMM